MTMAASDGSSGSSVSAQLRVNQECQGMGRAGRLARPFQIHLPAQGAARRRLSGTNIAVIVEDYSLSRPAIGMIFDAPVAQLMSCRPDVVGVGDLAGRVQSEWMDAPLVQRLALQRFTGMGTGGPQIGAVEIDGGFANAAVSVVTEGVIGKLFARRSGVKRLTSERAGFRQFSVTGGCWNLCGRTRNSYHSMGITIKRRGRRRRCVFRCFGCWLGRQWRQ